MIRFFNGNARCKREKKKYQLLRFIYSWGHRLLFLIYLAETEIHWNEDHKKIKQQTNLDRHGPRPIANACHLPDRTCFSLQTTFKRPWDWCARHCTGSSIITSHTPTSSSSPASSSLTQRISIIRSCCFLFLCFSMYCIQHCFNCRPSDSTVSEDAGIESKNVATSALAVRRSKPCG